MSKILTFKILHKYQKTAKLLGQDEVEAANARALCHVYWHILFVLCFVLKSYLISSHLILEIRKPNQTLIFKKLLFMNSWHLCFKNILKANIQTFLSAILRLTRPKCLSCGLFVRHIQAFLFWQLQHPLSDVTAWQLEKLRRGKKIKNK